MFAIKIIIALVGIYVIFKSLKGLFTKKETDIPNCMLSVGFVSVSLLLWLGNFSIDITAGRYISYLPLFLAVLLSRADFKYSISSKALLCFVSVIVLAFSIRGTVNTEPYNRYSQLAGYLEDENLTNGYGAFWDSHVLTGYSEGRIQVLPVKNTENGVAPRLWFSKAEPYYKQKNTFFVLRTSPEDEQEKKYNNAGIHNEFLGSGKTYGRTYELPLDYNAIVKTFGEPKEIKTFKNYKILIYENMSSNLVKLTETR